MWEIMLIVFVKREHAASIQEPSIKTHRDGLLGMVGNKGGIQVSFSVYNHVFNFVGGHLRHGQGAVDARNEMISNMMKTFKSKNESTHNIDCDVLADYSFIFGDLNYRMNTDFTSLIGKIDQASSLRLKLDQLERCRKGYHEDDKGLGMYPDYEEPPISFAPSYKTVSCLKEQMISDKKPSGASLEIIPIHPQNKKRSGLKDRA